MQTISAFRPAHGDVVHDLQYDFYAKRLATASADQHIKVWELITDSEDGSSQWVLAEDWKAHDAPVLRCCWAHPEFGSVIASCSFDRSIRIWEESPVCSTAAAAAAVTPLGAAPPSFNQAQLQDNIKPSTQRWQEVARLVDSRGTVQDIEFAPSYLGLRLATISVDGVLRIYEAMDIVNLAHWTLMDDFDVVQATTTTTTGSTSANLRERDAEFSLSWCSARYLPPQLVIACNVGGGAGVVKIFRQCSSGGVDGSLRTWKAYETLGSHADTVHDVSWAPSIGRSYQLVATACRDQHVRIFKLTPELQQHRQTTSTSATTEKGFRVDLVADLTGHDSEVWRVSWNVTGTILCSSGSDGVVLLWKSNYLGEWSLMSRVDTADSTISGTAGEPLMNR